MFVLQDILNRIQKAAFQKKSFNLKRSKIAQQPFPGYQEQVPQGLQEGKPVPFGSEEAPVQEVPVEEVSVQPQPSIQQPTKQIPYQLDGSDLVARYLDKLVSKTNDPRVLDDEFLVDGVFRKLGTPEDPKFDHRLFFFDENRNLIPDNVKNVLENSPYRHTDFVDSIFKSQGEEVPLYHQEMFQSLIQKLRDLVEDDQGFEIVKKWVQSGISSVKKKREHPKERGYYGPGEEDVSVLQITEDTGEALSDRARIKDTAEDINISNSMVSSFATNYLGSILSEVGSLTYDVFRQMSDMSQQLILMPNDADKNRGMKMQEKAQKLIVYIDSSLKQLKKMFSSGGEKDVSITSSGDDMSFSTSEGKMTIHNSEIKNLFANIINKRG